MSRYPAYSQFIRHSFALCLWLTQQQAFGHGGVVLEDDLCLIKIGYHQAHFKVYLPRLRQHEAFCEDLPEAGESVFVLEYIHSGLGKVPIDFRIIRNVTGQGRYTRWEDVRKIRDLDAVTVYHQPFEVQPDIFTVLHEFEKPGEFVGIVTAGQPDSKRFHTAVFPFDVGFTGFGIWPLVAVAALALQLNYLWMSGWFTRRVIKKTEVP